MALFSLSSNTHPLSSQTLSDISTYYEISRSEDAATAALELSVIEHHLTAISPQVASELQHLLQSYRQSISSTSNNVMISPAINQYLHQVANRQSNISPPRGSDIENDLLPLDIDELLMEVEQAQGDAPNVDPRVDTPALSNASSSSEPEFEPLYDLNTDDVMRLFETTIETES